MRYDDGLNSDSRHELNEDIEAENEIHGAERSGEVVENHGHAEGEREAGVEGTDNGHGFENGINNDGSTDVAKLVEDA